VGRVASIDFGFALPVRPAAVLAAMRSNGFALSWNGTVSYIIDDDGMFDWQEASEDLLGEVITEMDEASPRGATLVMVVMLDGFPHGGDVLFSSGGLTVSFCITINNRRLPGGSKFCDTGWYLQRLVPVLEPLGLNTIEISDI
jgi:hypothetical protein